ncbi:hypothetical protein NSB25_26655 [Acetatifactor muris]|nr:hypothetical protein [Acetatifactor muris]MCR2050815.1 hypothetical protein [Acetatifactor muris]
MMGDDTGNVTNYNPEIDMHIVPTEDEIAQSNLLRNEAWQNIHHILKEELSENDMNELRAAFYDVSGGYLFKRK